MDALLQAIESAGHLLVTTHADPDGDAVGSLMAMGLGLTRLGKEVSFYVESPIPAVYRFLPAIERIRRRLPTWQLGIDASPMVVILAIYFLQWFLVASLHDLAWRMR